MNSNRTTCLIVIALAAPFSGCDANRDAARPASRNGDGSTATDAGPAWARGGGQPLIRVDPTEDDEEMLEAIAEAKRTAAEACGQWLSLPGTEREKWLIKWAVPQRAEDRDGELPATRIEYVWVRPLHWSPFRVEGTLVTEPVSDIGFSAGDLVSFPTDELADWIYRLDGTMTGPRQGGFTVDVLEKRYGSPGE